MFHDDVLVIASRGLERGLAEAIEPYPTADLAKYDTSKGTIHFSSDKPLPDTLVRKLVEARIAENEALDRKTGKR